MPRILFALLLLLAAVAADSAAQQIRGSIVSAESGAPISGAIVSLLDDRDEPRAGTLSDEQGRFVLTAPRPGTFRLKAERVGFETTYSPPVQLSGGATTEQHLAAAPRAVALEGITVRASSRCRAGPGSGPETHRVWEEARKALAAVALTESLRTVRFDIRTFDRTKDRSGRVISERSGARQVVSDYPFRSDPSADLLQRGFIQRAGADLVYHGPDAQVLLSDGFQEAYCFSLRRAADRPGMIGLAFEPVPQRRHLPGVTGALWLDERTGELRTLDYRYTRFPSDNQSRLASAPQAGSFGGTVDFEQLEYGAWIVSAWTIRIPHFYAAAAGASPTTLGVRETGGDVRAVHLADRTRERRARTGALQGRVLESDGDAPVEGAIVYLSGTQHTATTDAEGSYRFEDLNAGRYLLAAYHPGIEIAAALLPSREVTIAEGETTDAALLLPGLATRMAGTCAGDPGSAGAVIAGVVREAGSGLVLAGVRVALRPAEGSGPAVHTTTDASGSYRFCGVSGPRRYRVLAELGRYRSAEGELAVASGAIIRSDLLLDVRAPVRVTGQVLDDGTRRPISGARVRVVGTERTALTDARGRFVLEQVPTGDQRIEVSHLGFGTHGEDVTLQGTASEMTIRLGERAIEIEGVVATATTRSAAGLEDFHRRRAMSRGGAVFLDRAALERRGATRLENILGEYSIVVDPSGVTMPRGASGFGPCGPMVYIDGTAVTKLNPGGMAVRPDEARDALRMVGPADIEAIEIYRGASQVPSELGGTGGGCGVIALWTRRGP